MIWWKQVINGISVVRADFKTSFLNCVILREHDLQNSTPSEVSIDKADYWNKLSEIE